MHILLKYTLKGKTKKNDLLIMSTNSVIQQSIDSTYKIPIELYAEIRVSSHQRRTFATDRQGTCTQFVKQNGQRSQRKPLVSRSRSSIHIVMCTFALLQKLCRGLKRARREKSEARDKVSRGRGGSPHSHRFAELSFRGNCKRARAPPSGMEAAKRR